MSSFGKTRPIKYVLLFLLVMPLAVCAQITFVGVGTNPADASSSAVNTSTPVVVTPPAAAQVGDLVIMIGQRRGTGGTINLSAQGGQTWTSLTAFGTTNVTGRIFWCRFNGTWSGGNPSLIYTTGGGTSSSVQMLVFRPSKRTNLWASDVTQTATAFAAPANPFTASRTGVTTTNNSTVTLAVFMSIDDNTWGATASTNWSQAGLANQYRNSGGTQQSSSYAYQIKTTFGATGNVTKNQSASDAGVTAILSFYEYQRGMPLYMF